MILVLNLGLKSIRAIIFDSEGRKLSSAARPLHTLLDGHRVEQTPDDWWRLAAEVVREAVSGRSFCPNLQAMTVTASSSCLVCLDKDGNPLLPSIMVSDSRDLVERAAFSEAGFPDRQLPMLCRMRWVLEHRPEVHGRTRWLTSINGFLTSRLTGRYVTDPLNAEKSGWDVESARWNEAALALAGLSAGQMPEVESAGACVGPVTVEAREHLGLQRAQNLKLYLSSYDAICAIFGSGVHGEDGEACDVSGTVTSLRAISRRQPETCETDAVYQQFEATHGLYITGGSNNLGGGIIEWARQTFYAEERHPYEVMATEAESCPPGAEGLVFLPYLLGERAPLWDSNLRAVFFGMERHHTRRHIARAIFESTALGLVALKREIEKRTGPLRTIYASGGLARIPLITQIKADVLNAEIRVLDEFESTAFGAAILAGVESGFFPSLEQATDLVQTRSIVVPTKRNRVPYAALTEFYFQLLESVQPLFRLRRERLLPALPQEVSVIGNL